MGQSSKRRRSQTLVDKTLEQLDGEKWGDPPYNSYVVRTCHAIRLKPLGTLTDEELRLAIGQQMGLEWLMPLALERLRQDPFCSGDFYDGDLLASAVRVSPKYWAKHPEQKALFMQEIITRALHDRRLSGLDDDDRQALIALGTIVR